MPSFLSVDDVEIAYYEWGARTDCPVVLQHGFVVNSYICWKRTGTVDALVDAGHWVVAVDARGHGSSGKPHDPSRYGEGQMANDLARLLDVLGAPRADLAGYSMGAVACLILATRDPRIRRMVVAGVGTAIAQLGGPNAAARTQGAQALAAALLAEDASSIEGLTSAAFRALADRLGGDRHALAAQAAAMHNAAIPLGQITAPTLVIGGDADLFASGADDLAEAIPGATALVLSGDHLTVPASPAFMAAIVKFLDQQ
jgi:pimeloyl-ACP methyl ester carboxylesterase